MVYGVLFIVPTIAAFYFSLTRWTIFESQFIGFDNYVTFFQEPALVSGLTHTLVYAVVTSAAKVVLGMLLAILLTSQIVARGYLRSVVFFPVLVSTIGVGLTFTVLMNPEQGLINDSLALIGIDGPAWLVDPKWALLSVALVDIWKGVGLATLIYIAGIVSIPRRVLRGGQGRRGRPVGQLPADHPAAGPPGHGHRGPAVADRRPALVRPDLGDDQGRPGFTSDVIASVIYKQYQAGFYGLSTAGNVILFLLVTAIIFPLSRFLNRKEVDL